MLDPDNPVYNTLIIYILIVCLIIALKPSSMYNYKINKFKSFGFAKEQTPVSFPVVVIGSGILLYMFFLWINVINRFLQN